MVSLRRLPYQTSDSDVASTAPQAPSKGSGMRWLQSVVESHSSTGESGKLYGTPRAGPPLFTSSHGGGRGASLPSLSNPILVPAATLHYQGPFN